MVSAFKPQERRSHFESLPFFFVRVLPKFALSVENHGGTTLRREGRPVGNVIVIGVSAVRKVNPRWNGIANPRGRGQYGHVGSQIPHVATWMCSRLTVGVIGAFIFDNYVWMAGDEEPIVRGNFAAFLTSSHYMFASRTGPPESAQEEKCTRN
jgi:hypothetical protein